MRPLFLFCGLAIAQLSFAQVYNEKISPRLQDRLERYPGVPQDVLLLLEEREDMVALEAELDRAQATLEQRGRRVIARLQTRAADSQAGLLRTLADRTDVGRVRPYWVVNVVFADCRPTAIDALSRDARIALIDWNAPLEVEALTRTAAPTAFAPDATEPGLEVVNAPALWALGYSGAGRVGMVNDTGTDLEHPALANRYLGGYVNDTLTFFDQSERSATTYDCGSHGTHVAGTMVGLDRENADTIGVAFNANWTAGSILCGIGTEDNLSSFQWALNPDGDSTTIADMPDVINNSWYDPSLDTTDCASFYVPLLQAVEAAGIAVVFSAGNAGPEPMTITPPHNINTDIVNSFTVAAVNGNVATLPVADFSSRGPSQCGGAGSLLIKPEVSAPGVNVRSCIPGNDYALFSGTSMAAPHVSGVILLLKEAFPYLTGRELKLALYYSAVDMGEPGEDNVFGNGMIDARAAYDYLVAQGHEPVPPVVVENDLMLLEFSKERRYCDQTVLAGTAKVFNNGTQTVDAFTLEYRTGATGVDVPWTGQLEPGQTAYVALPELPMHPTLGNMLLELTVVAADGSDDDLPRNNRVRQRIEILDRPSVGLSAEGGESLCTPGSTLLSASTQDAAEAAFSWYAEADADLPLHTGDRYVPAPTDSSTTVYLGVDYTQSMGLTDETAADAEMADIDEQGLRFDTYVPIVIRSVKVYSESAGLRIIRVTNAFGRDAGTSTINLPAGESRVTLNFDVPVGNDWFLQGNKIGISRKLSVSRDAATFPYEKPDIMAITGNLDPDDDDDYYFFYDWEVSYQEPCGRQAITLTVADPDAAPLAAFELSSDTVRLGQDGTVSVAPVNASTTSNLLWDFGNGDTSTEAAPVAGYTVAGNYRIRLRGSTDDCVSYAARDLTVLEPLTAVRELPRLDARVFPNPTDGPLRIELAQPQRIEVRLFDTYGRLHLRLDGRDQHTEIDLSTLVPGVYFLEVRGKEGHLRERILLE